MSKYLEDLHSGQLSQSKVERDVITIRNRIQERSRMLATLQDEQTQDKREIGFLESALESYKKSQEKVRRSQYIRKGIHSIGEVFDLVGRGRITLATGETVNTSSIRYRLFKEKGITCVTCGLVGQYFALEKDNKETEEIYHFNLYGIRAGKEILFTRDHIQPRSKGGKDTMSNLQTMCTTCNCKKGNVWEEGEE